MNTGLIQILRDHQSRQSCDSLTQPECQMCTTLSGTSTDTGEPFWLQILGGQLNFQHLAPPEKDFMLTEILDMEGLAPESVELEPGLYVTLRVDRMPGPVVDELLTQILRDYLVVDEATVEITTENFG